MHGVLSIEAGHSQYLINVMTITGSVTCSNEGFSSLDTPAQVERGKTDPLDTLSTQLFSKFKSPRALFFSKGIKYVNLKFHTENHS